MTIEQLKTFARRLTKAHMWEELSVVIHQLESQWKDDKGAVEFYKELEQTGEFQIVNVRKAVAR